ncbi:MAG: WecB/TagA/CpsF family glycosyltransferase [Gammaproteobacteria bacterium]|nr:WecB/TagA/CpsF family glycosyltransferase [Gammaproteobacteria bacterium]
MRTHILSLDDSASRVKDFISSSNGRYVCVSNVHMCMEAFDDSHFREIVNSADLTIPDGMPLTWAQKLLGHKEAKQVRGYDLTLALCQMAAKENIPVGFFGATPELLRTLGSALCDKYPGLNIAYSVSPPFRKITAEEDQQHTADINASGVKILFVGLGCPKQEWWMAEHREALHCTMLGVGAAFDFIAGNKKKAPLWLQKIGLEWLFRLATEPKRLWKRYLKHNPRFIYYLILQLLGKKHAP